MKRINVWLEIGRTVCEWLNRQAPEKAASMKVAKLIEALQGLEPILREHPLVEDRPNGTTQVLSKSPGEILRKAINSQLIGCNFTPSLYVEDRNSMRVSWLPVGESAEVTMIGRVCELYNAEKLSLVCRCEGCDLWLAKTKSDRKFCSVKCRSNWHAQTELGKAYHGEKAKEQHQRVREPKLQRCGRC